MNNKIELSSKIARNAILSIIFTLLVFTIIIAYILSIVNIVRINGTDWENLELNQSKNGFAISSIICIIFFTPIIPAIISLVWASKCKIAIEAKVVK